LKANSYFFKVTINKRFIKKKFSMFLIKMKPEDFKLTYEFPIDIEIGEDKILTIRNIAPEKREDIHNKSPEVLRSIICGYTLRTMLNDLRVLGIEKTRGKPITYNSLVRRTRILETKTLQMTLNPTQQSIQDEPNQIRILELEEKCSSILLLDPHDFWQPAKKTGIVVKSMHAQSNVYNIPSLSVYFHDLRTEDYQFLKEIQTTHNLAFRLSLLP
jgi:hypothetical protein